MNKAIEKKKIYCFDTSAFLALSRTDEKVIKIDSSVWQQLEDLMKSGSIVSHRIVFDEIISGTKNPLQIMRWIKNKKKFFLKKTDEQIATVPKIVRKFPGLIDAGRESEQADPWLIALAIEILNKNTLFESNLPIVVNQENKHSSKKIPAACKQFNVGHCSLREFFDDIGLSTKIIKKY